MTMRKRAAFSLFEIAVTVVIVSVIIVAIFQGSDLLRTVRVNSAQSLTLSAPVRSMKGVSLWLEPTVSESFVTDSDGEPLTQWNDNNTQATSKYYATKAASGAVTYKKESPLHTLPAVYFNGTSSGYLTLSTSASPSDATTAPVARNNAFTVIAVAKSDGVSSSNGAALISNGDSGGYSYVINSNGERQLVFPGSATLTSTSATASTSPEVISITYEGGTDGIAKLFTNGVAESMNASTATATAPDGALYVGGNPSDMPWKGYVGEVIVFNRLLSDNERKQIEQYLGQKYKIEVNSEIKPSSGLASGNISDCTFSLSGIAETHVTNRDGVLNCIPGYSGSITYNCAGTSFSVVSGVCTPLTCTISGQSGIADGTTVNYGTTSKNCNIAGYSGTVTYNSCVSGAATVTSNNCIATTCTITGVTGFNNKTGLAYAASATAIPATACASGYTGSPTYTCTTTGAASITQSQCTAVNYRWTLIASNLSRWGGYTQNTVTSITCNSSTAGTYIISEGSAANLSGATASHSLIYRVSCWCSSSGFCSLSCSPTTNGLSNSRLYRCDT